VKLNTLTLTDIAKLGLFLDDPYGDGIRLAKVRNPNAGRSAAIAELKGEPLLDGERFIRAEYESVVRDPANWTKRGELISEIYKNIC